MYSAFSYTIVFVWCYKLEEFVANFKTFPLSWLSLNLQFLTIPRFYLFWNLVISP